MAAEYSSVKLPGFSMNKLLQRSGASTLLSMGVAVAVSVARLAVVWRHVPRGET
ncbi:hypothetical protein E2C01_085782 [Portunus trituberculatus]|uniref:Uncharacterized protein n=1 Tax=Portunus trituberculatus TaxID=210409 RepID=A0A5B7J3N0_PORTR|nr:hypothetical protein [Portunus trituberculatus]